MTTHPLRPAVSDYLDIAIRAYTETSDAKKVSNNTVGQRPPQWTLIFDTETTTDPGQALRFGTYQLRQGRELKGSGVFYDSAGITSSELATLQAYVKDHGLALHTRESFVDDILFSIAYVFRAAIVGFNLPFDISRLAISHNSARTPRDGVANAMRGGFTFQLSEKKWPRIQIKHMSRRAALIKFTAPMAQPSGRGQRKRRMLGSAFRGHFVDVNTFAHAQLSQSFSLARLGKHLNIEHPKLEFDEFDRSISETMIRYAVGDVQATWECYCALVDRFEKLGLDDAAPNKIYSEASIGKASLRAMRIRAWREMQPDFPPKLLGSIMSSYYGGRSEVRIRREVRQVILCDFLSMYPTVCTLMGLWRFVIAEGMEWRDATDDTRHRLDNVSLSDLRHQEQWMHLATLVRVIPNGEVFPVRAAYAEGKQTTIGSNHLTSDQPLWFTLADCITAKFLSGRAPRIVEAIAFTPGNVQTDLRSIDIGGNTAYSVDPAQDDFFRSVITRRQGLKTLTKSAADAEREILETEQHSLKILANSTSYGIFAEVNVDEPQQRKTVTVYGPGEPFSFQAKLIEESGQFFHPLLAALITGAARLMLAIAETLASERELDWAFCDTDSMAFARSESMDAQNFGARVREVVDWFAALNPYSFPGSILKIEDVNDGLLTRQPEPLYCFTISAKRYALFNLDSDGVPVMRKVSAHGLGHLLPPYTLEDAPADLPKPHESVLRDGTARWHVDFWHQIICAALAGHPNTVQLNWHTSLGEAAISRYGANTPELLRWFKTYNSKRAYREQIKPFNFLLSLSPSGLDLSDERFAAKRGRGRPKRQAPIKPITPFSRNRSDIAARIFDRESGEAVSRDKLKSYAEALAQYHLHPEDKFRNGDYFDRGATQRRHVHATDIRLIGKESNDWERQAQLGWDAEAQPEYGVTVNAKLSRIEKRRIVRQDERDALLRKWRSMVESDGLREAARQLGVDPSNLRRKIKNSRPAM